MGGESEVFITPFNAERLNSDLYQMVAAGYLRSCNTRQFLERDIVSQCAFPIRVFEGLQAI